MALDNRPDRKEIIDFIINGDREKSEIKTDDQEFFCLDFTSFCSNSCFYCERSRDNWDLKRSRMTKEEIVAAFKEPYDKGLRSFVLYGGVDIYFMVEKVVAIVEAVKKDYPDCKLYLGIGEKVYEDYQAYKNAGADGFVLFHRSANEDHFARLHKMEMYPDFRKKMMPYLRGIGLELGTGITAGWPHQTVEILAEDVEYVLDLKPELLVVDYFIPQPHTQYEGSKRGDIKQRDNVIKLISKLLPDTKILTHL